MLACRCGRATLPTADKILCEQENRKSVQALKPGCCASPNAGAALLFLRTGGPPCVGLHSLVTVGQGDGPRLNRIDVLSANPSHRLRWLDQRRIRAVRDFFGSASIDRSTEPVTTRGDHSGPQARPPGMYDSSMAGLEVVLRHCIPDG